ncbi:primosomal protein N' [Dolosicoccus paucivorans]|uniref:Replication restart protein PriA n=1 Tax=Dolosicoccus paucivorans TaxID=84521 RepID=A0A2N6SMV9_9LACT|nr:primosomal protein N' [Dolosicoccus paucivorans]PMC58392.1 primosomal protein N' [Dolosicoccus paucivorans]
MNVKVIVDLPNAQVNRPFDYHVPKEWESLIQLGMRVEVPFGRRQLLGFIVELNSQTDYDGKLKDITGLLDYESFLNEELIELSEYLTKQLQVFQITVLQAMLPSVLRVKYDVRFNVLDQESLVNEYPQLNEMDSLSKEALESQLTHSQIARLIKDGTIQAEYLVKNQATNKKVTYLQLNQTDEGLQKELEQLSNRSYRQKELLQFLLTQPQEMSLTTNELSHRSGVSPSIIQTAIQKEWLRQTTKTVYRDPLADQEIKNLPKQTLLPEQQRAYESVKHAMDQHQAETFLLEGVTGSGKTEVYLQLMEEALNKGQSSILLVPEIALTPQMVERVVGRFKEGVAILHSGLSNSERYDEWRRIIRKEAQIVIGARSSIFAPLDNLGLIIIDEEHETVYKQADNPRYHARDVAIWRSKYHQCPVLLGSATPSLESRARAQVGNYILLKMTQRVHQRPLPPIELVDLTKERIDRLHPEFSDRLVEAIKERLDRKEQIVLLLNRRGYATYILCRECGKVVGCPHCDISLTYHKVGNQLKCHYCDYTQPVPKTCPHCHSQHIYPVGSGIQKVAEALQELFPTARVIRMDNDTTRRKGQHHKLLQQFRNHEADILLGTQMIAKGLDFHNVTLVGVINADTALNLPDFRATERTFQLLTQVAGRTGRGELRGEVIIQTYNPNHYVMQLAKRHDYERFFAYEMKRRHLAHYPPYYYTTLVTITSKKRALAQRKAYEVKNHLLCKPLPNPQSVIILGPSQAPIARINDVYYYQLILKYKDVRLIQKQLEEIIDDNQKEHRQGLYVNIDHNPLFFM